MLQAIADKVLVRRDAPETVTSGGIVLPDSVQEKRATGEVISVGEGGYNHDGQFVPMTVKVGQRVLFHRYNKDEFEHEGETLVSVKQRDILAILS